MAVACISYKGQYICNSPPPPSLLLSLLSLSLSPSLSFSLYESFRPQKLPTIGIPQQCTILKFN